VSRIKTEIKLSDIIAPHFYDIHRDIKKHRHTYYWEEGGRGSTKSSHISIEIVLLLLKNPDCHAVVLRKVGNTIKNSVYTQMQWAIDRLGLTSKFKFKTSPHEITYKKTGQKILFMGVDDPQKIKSIKLPFGYIGICWCEELDQFGGMEEIRSLNQSLLRGGPIYWEFCSFNPPKSQNNWVNAEKLNDVPGRIVHHSTYLGVPKSWLGERFFIDAEILRRKNEMSYRHEYLGEVTGTGGDVFSNVEDMRISDQMIEQFDHLCYGLDFGFAVDPLAFNSMHYDRKHEILYIFGEIDKVGFETDPAAKAVKELAKHRLVIADSAEPRTIREFEKRGVNIKGCRKGPDSVEHGIKWLQDRRKIIIDKERCPKTFREFVGYEYQQDKEGNFISRFPDKNNHHIDAVRYGNEYNMLDDVFSFK
jgi:PBSX family phage terminase large subunit